MEWEKFEDAKGVSETINKRRADNTMARRKGTKRQTRIQKTKDWTTQITPLKQGMTAGAPKG